jgi:hypothetical protein
MMSPAFSLTHIAGEPMMRSSFTELARRITLGIVATAACASVAFADDGEGGRRNLDRVFVIMMENHGFDQVVGALQPGADAEQLQAVTLANEGGEPLKMRSELEIGRRLAFVLELIARGELKARPPTKLIASGEVQAEQSAQGE